MIHYVILLFFYALIFLTSCNKGEKHELIKHWDPEIKRTFLGESYWANRLQDWQVNRGRIECIGGVNPLRTVHLLNHELNDTRSGFLVELTVGLIHGNSLDKDDFVGLLIGAGSLDIDYRGRSLIFGRPGINGGFIAGFNGNEELVILDMEKDLDPLSALSLSNGQDKQNKGITLLLEVTPSDQGYEIKLREKGQNEGIVAQISEDKLTGNIALAAHGGENASNESFWFRDLTISGDKVSYDPERTMGPIVSTQHTLSNNTLNITGQLMPVSENDPTEVTFMYKGKDQPEWLNTVRATLNRPSYISTFQIEDWDDTKDYDYRMEYSMKDNSGIERDHSFEGTIRKNPAGKEELVVAAFTGNNNTSWHSNSFDRTRLFFPHEDLTANVFKHDPDFLFYSGDQLYENSPSPPDRSGGRSSMLDYLYKWYLWCWAHRELTRNIPSVSIPDDHDVFHGNVWGDGGSVPPKEPEGGIYPEHYRGGFEGHWVQDQGGYRMGAEFVNMVDQTQTSHLPDPYDPTTVKNNIGVYYTDINYGGISFAVLEDRKFKSPPSRILPEAKIINGFSQLDNYDGTRADRPEAKLLGERQLRFIRDWSSDWENTWMKVSLSQTIFANVSTYPDSFKTDAGTPRLDPLPQGVIPEDYRLARDMDSNGWPQSGRNRALAELRKGFTFMIAGDQHLGSVVHHGIDDWEDAGISFCVPSVANVWPRRWFPPEPGLDHQPGQPEYTGRYFDGFGNRITVHAVSNPYKSGIYPEELHDRAPGYGIVKLNKKEQTIIIECWPRHADPSKQDAEQYPGWPVTVNVQENYNRKAAGWLPQVNVRGLENPPVIQVIREDPDEIIYTLRVDDHTFHPKVFQPGRYSIRIGEPGTSKMKKIENLRSTPGQTQEPIEITF